MNILINIVNFFTALGFLAYVTLIAGYLLSYYYPRVQALALCYYMTKSQCEIYAAMSSMSAFRRVSEAIQIAFLLLWTWWSGDTFALQASLVMYVVHMAVVWHTKRFECAELS